MAGQGKTDMTVRYREFSRMTAVVRQERDINFPSLTASAPYLPLTISPRDSESDTTSSFPRSQSFQKRHGDVRNPIETLLAQLEQVGCRVAA